MPLRIRPDQAMQEIQEFSAKLGQGLKNLSELGEIEIGATPKEVIYREDKMVLYRFVPPEGLAPPGDRSSIPLLIVYALVNRPYMTDIQEDRSIVRGLLAGGIDVYLIDWGYPDSGDRFLTLDDYINGYIDRCVDAIRRRRDADQINLMGICQGGTFSLCYAALHPDKVRNLITTVTPVDFHTPDNLLSSWLRNVDVDLLVDAMGNIPGPMMNLMYLSLKPYRLAGQKYVDMVDQLDGAAKAQNFMRIEKWIFDSPDQAGEAFRQFSKDFYQRNGLVTGGITIGDRQVDLKQVTMPVLNIYAAADHLVPPAASKALEGLTGTDDYTALEFPGGHVGVYVSGKSQTMIPPTISRWLAERV